MKAKARLTITIPVDEEFPELCAEGCRFGIFYGAPICALFHVGLDLSEGEALRCAGCLKRFKAPSRNKGAGP